LPIASTPDPAPPVAVGVTIGVGEVGVFVGVGVGVSVLVAVGEGVAVALATLVGGGPPTLALLTIGKKTRGVEPVALERARSADTALEPADADKTSQPSTRSPRQSTTRAKTSRFIRHHDPALGV
jgi:hypothetical protein